MNIVNIKKDCGKCFVFSPYKFELVVATTSCKIRFYDLKVKGGTVPTREISNAHRDSINSISFSQNGHYFLTCGADKNVKIFDSDADKISPYYFQSFIGHTFPVEKAFFNPMNNGQCISVGGRDGIHLWRFIGDVSTNYNPPAEEFLLLKDSMKYKLGDGAKSNLYQQLLEAENNKNKNPEGSGDLDNKENINAENVSETELAKGQPNDDSKHYQEFKETPLVQEGPEFQPEDRPEIKEDDDDFEHADEPDQDAISEKRYSYNGTTAHDNVIWIRNRKLTLFTSGNEIIVENSNTGIQTVFENGHETEISALAISQDERILASCAAEVDSQGTAPIILWDLDDYLNKIYELRSHEIGVKNMLFSKDGAYLISQGCNDERSIIIWNIEDGLVLKSTICPTHYRIRRCPVSPFV